MRAIPGGLASELATPVVSLCRIFAITRKTGAVVRFAEAPTAVTVGGITYPPAKGIRVSSIPFELNARASTYDIEVGVEDGGTIDPDDLRNGLYTSASIACAVVNHIAPASGSVALHRGIFGNIQITDTGQATVQVLGLFAKARAIPVENYTPTCRAFFGDARCKKPLGPLTVSTTITAVSGFHVTVAASLAAHYKLGLVVPTTGQGVGEGFEIRAVSGGVLSMYLPPGGKLAVGDAVNITPGCDFTMSGAQGCLFWANAVNFRGEPNIPGADAVSISYSEWGA
jgi:uncharacterized phage protein (TIGR02218 family)